MGENDSKEKSENNLDDTLDETILGEETFDRTMIDIDAQSFIHDFEQKNKKAEPSPQPQSQPQPQSPQPVEEKPQERESIEDMLKKRRSLLHRILRFFTKNK